jgi:hypothetical protein
MYNNNETCMTIMKTQLRKNIVLLVLKVVWIIVGISWYVCSIVITVKIIQIMKIIRRL